MANTAQSDGSSVFTVKGGLLILSGSGSLVLRRVWIKAGGVDGSVGRGG